MKFGHFFRRFGPSGLVVSVVLLALAAGAGVRADVSFPTPGGAPGAQTGDGHVFVGLAASPGPDMFSGTATTSIKVVVPPGRRQSTPQLVLTYSSSAGASPYGYGWSLPLARIVRSTKTGVPHYDSSDTFVLEGAGGSSELTAVPGTPRFREKRGASFLRIGFDETTNSWTVIDKSGNTMIFGLSRATRLGPMVDRGETTYAWLLERTIDPFGNEIDYSYVQRGRSAAPPGLPSEIAYGGNSAAGQEHVFFVDFSWTERPYPSVHTVSYRAGYAEPDDLMLERIETYVGDRLVRRYSMSHSIDPASGTLLLVGVSLDALARDEANDVALPSTVFRYSPAVQLGWPAEDQPDRAQSAVVFDSPGPFRDLGKTVLRETFDINGDAIVDYVDATVDPPVVRLGTGNGFSEPVVWAWPPGVRYVRRAASDGRLMVNLFDLTGDGLPDLVDARSNACGAGDWCVYVNTGRGFEEAPLSWSAPVVGLRRLSVDGADVTIDTVDVDGDRRPDLIDSRRYSDSFPYWDVYMNSGSGFDVVPVPIPAPAPRLSRSATSGPTSHLLEGLYDINGDGLPDYVDADVADRGFAEPRSVDHWNVFLGTGYGFAVQPTTWRIEQGGESLLLDNYVNEHTSDETHASVLTDFVDVTGDGLPDRVRFWSQTVVPGHPLEFSNCQMGLCASSSRALPLMCCYSLLVFVNTGASFSYPVEMPWWDWMYLRSYSDDSSPAAREVDLFDADGDGLIDLVEREGDQWRIFRHPASPLATASSTPDSDRARPNVMVAMLNGVGGETFLSYLPATAYGLQAIPFAYWVVSRREVVDGIASAPAGDFEYWYRGGWYDGAAREFRGFSETLEIDAMGRGTATRFHQDEQRQGLVAASMVLGSTGCSAIDPFDRSDPCSPYQRVLLESTNEWAQTPPVLLVRRTSVPYHGGKPVSDLAKTLAYEYDDYGNVLREIVSSPSAGAVETTTEYAYSAADRGDGVPQRYLVDRPIRVVTRSLGLDSRPVSESRYVYDAAEPRTGALKQASVCIDWSDGACTEWSTTSYVYDRFGNVTAVRDANGGRTRNIYDEWHLYAVSTRDPGRYVTSTLRDPANGTVIEAVGADGVASGADYDGLGRIVRSWTGDFSREDPEVSISYVDGVPGSHPGQVRTARYGQAPEVAFYDGLGRLLATKTQVEIDSGIVTVVDNLSFYGVIGQVIARAPRFVAPDQRLEILRATIVDAPALVESVYDSDGRLTERRFPDGSSIRFDRSVPGVTATVLANLTDGRFPGKAQIEVHDGFGRVREQVTCDRVPQSLDPVDCGAPPLVVRRFSYDVLDRPTERIVVGENGAASALHLTYDGLGNRTTLVSSDRGVWSYRYSSAGNLLQIDQPNGEQVRMRYDRLGRLRIQRASDSKAKYIYYRRGPGAGKLRRIRAFGSGSSRVAKEFEYDELGRLRRETLSIRAGGPARAYTTNYAWDRAGRRVSRTYPSSVEGVDEVVTTDYSPLGGISRVVADGPEGRRTIVAGTSTDLFGNLIRIDFGNGLSDRFEYAGPEAMGRLLCSRTALVAAPGGGCAGDAGDLARVMIAERDAAGNVLMIDDQVDPVGSELDRGATYSYDALGRIIEATSRGSAAERFAYDGLGNMTRIGGNVLVYAGGAPHQAVTFGTADLAHDAAGNRTAKGAWSYEYDSLGRLVRITLGGELRQENFYDEGQTRVARYDAVSNLLRYYFGGAFEVEGDRLVRHYYMGGRLVASDHTVAPAGLSLSTARTAPSGPPDGLGRGRAWADGTTTVGVKGDAGTLVSLPAPPAGIPPHVSLVCLGVVSLLLAVALAPPGGRVALATAVCLIVFVTPLPRGRSTQGAIRVAAAEASGGMAGLVYYHLDRLGSPHMITGPTGEVLEYLRYGAYGAVRARLDGTGSPLDGRSNDVEFGAHTWDDASGLLYLGARYYDPELGLFLTPDPEAQFASPYLYGGGNPVNGRDGNGEFFETLLAILLPIFVAGTVSACLSGIAAAIQGGDFVEALQAGFVVGVMGAGLGTLAGGLNIAYQMGTAVSQSVSAAEAAQTLAQVSARASFTTIVSSAAVSTGAAAGLDSDWLTAIGVVAALGASAAYDHAILKSTRLPEEGAAESAREMVEEEGAVFRPASTTTEHLTITEEAAMDTGLEHVADELAKYNVEQDGGFGTQWERLWRQLNNEGHFGRVSERWDDIHKVAATVARPDGSYGPLPLPVIFEDSVAGKLNIPFAGAAAHFTQDFLTLGHMVPGTSLLAGPLGAPARLVIHQVFGGEIGFWNAQLRMTRALFSEVYA